MTRWINTTQYHGNKDAVVHTDPGCQYVSAMSLTEEEANVEFDDLETCSWCADEWVTPEEKDIQCTFCGDMIDRYPDHLPCEESP